MNWAVFCDVVNLIVAANPLLVLLDVRLNPNLLKYCSFDIKRHCDTEYKNAKAKDIDAEGVVIGCLRRKFAEKVKLELVCW